MSDKPIISFVLGTYNRLEFLKLTIDSIRKDTLNIPYEMIVIDGGSDDGTLEWLVTQKDIITIVQHNRGEWNGKSIKRKSWGYFMNLGFKCAQGKYVCMLSDDCLLIPGCIEHAYELFEKELSDGKHIGAMAFYWRDWPVVDTYNVYETLGNTIFVNHGMYLKQALIDVDYIDEEVYLFYAADCDLCLKLRQKGYICSKSPHSFVEHYAHANLKVRSTNYTNRTRDQKAFLNKWRKKYSFNEIEDINSILAQVHSTKEFCDENKTVEKFEKFREKQIEQNQKKLQQIDQLFSKILQENKTISIYAAGEHTAHLLHKTILKYGDIKYIVDSKKQGTKFENYPVKSPEILLDEKTDVIIISSFAYQQPIYEYIRNELKYDGKIIKLYTDQDYLPFYA